MTSSVTDDDALVRSCDGALTDVIDGLYEDNGFEKDGSQDVTYPSQGHDEFAYITGFLSHPTNTNPILAAEHML